MSHANDIEAGAIIEASTGTHFLIITDDLGAFRLVNIDAGWWLLERVFPTAEDVVNFFDDADANLPADDKCAIDRIIPKWAVKVREERNIGL